MMKWKLISVEFYELTCKHYRVWGEMFQWNAEKVYRICHSWIHPGKINATRQVRLGEEREFFVGVITEEIFFSCCNDKSTMLANKASEQPNNWSCAEYTFGKVRKRGFALAYVLTEVIFLRHLVIEELKADSVICASWLTLKLKYGLMCKSQGRFISIHWMSENDVV